MWESMHAQDIVFVRCSHFWLHPFKVYDDEWGLSVHTGNPDKIVIVYMGIVVLSIKY